MNGAVGGSVHEFFLGWIVVDLLQIGGVAKDSNKGQWPLNKSSYTIQFVDLHQSPCTFSGSSLRRSQFGCGGRSEH